MASMRDASQSEFEAKEKPNNSKDKPEISPAYNIGLLCFFSGANPGLPLKYKYVIINGFEKDPFAADEMYRVTEVNPTADQFKSMHQPDDPRRDEGVFWVSKADLQPIVFYEQPFNYSWLKVRFHYEKIACFEEGKLRCQLGEYQQTLIWIAIDMHGTLNRPMYDKTFVPIKKKHKMSLQLFRDVGLRETAQLQEDGAPPRRKEGYVHKFDKICFEQLAEIVGRQFLAKQKRNTAVTYIAHKISAEYSEESNWFILRYWLGREENGVVQTHALADN